MQLQCNMCVRMLFVLALLLVIGWFELCYCPSKGRRAVLCMTRLALGSRFKRCCKLPQCNNVTYILLQPAYPCSTTAPMPLQPFTACAAVDPWGGIHFSEFYKAPDRIASKNEREHS
jgi:hypothetical protein